MPPKAKKTAAAAQQPASAPQPTAPQPTPPQPTPPQQTPPQQAPEHPAPQQPAAPQQQAPQQEVPQQAPPHQVPPQQHPPQHPHPPQQHPPQHPPQYAPQYAQYAAQHPVMQVHPYPGPPLAPHPHQHQHPHQMPPPHQPIPPEHQQYTDASNPYIHPSRARKPFVKRFHPLLGSIFPNLEFAHAALVHEAKRGGYAISVFTKRPSGKNPNRVIYCCSRAGTHTPRPLEEGENSGSPGGGNNDESNASIGSENGNEEDAGNDQEAENTSANASGNTSGTAPDGQRVIKRRKTTSNKTACPFRIAIKKNYAGRWTVEKVASEFDCTVHNHDMQDQYAFPRYRTEAVLAQKDRILQMAADGAKPSDIIAELSETEEAFCYITSKDISNFLNQHRRAEREAERQRPAGVGSVDAVSPDESAD